MSRRVILLAAPALAAAALLPPLTAGAAPHAPTSAAAKGGAATRGHAKARATTVIHVSPVNAAGHLKPGYAVKDFTKGTVSCSFGSEATGTAYRCYSFSPLFDPAWVTANPTYVDYLPTPWSHAVTRLHVKGKYDNTGYTTSDRSLPWGVEIPDGSRAAFAQGATGVVHGMRINYGIGDSFHRVLVGKVDKSHPAWRIHEATRVSGTYKLTGWVKLTKAWFGIASLKG